MPSIRTEEGRKQSLWNPTTREVEGDEASRAGTRVEQLVGVGTEAQSQSDDGTDCLSQDMGPSVKRAQTRVGSPQGPGLKSGPTASGLLWAYGSKLPPASEAPRGDQSGPWHSNGLGGVQAMREFTRCREEEMGRRQQPDPNNPRAERMLEEEAARGSIRPFWGRREGILVGSGSRRPNTEDHSGRRDGCWDLVEISSVDPTGRNLGWTTDQWASQEGRKEDQLNWRKVA
ncbi:hypothetical protein CK203_102375 [Vitis vinifera]|uniref:Uncharacterized protein n=1 Tax=Vitis vinifera TaxID=29760 RepID=A0A438DNH0_VITVI|nr:hypothetical protein CK203_102375 [Vitis vinifera]